MPSHICPVTPAFSAPHSEWRVATPESDRVPRGNDTIQCAFAHHPLLRIWWRPFASAAGRVGLDRQRATLLGKLRADWTGSLRAIRRRGFSYHGRCGKEQRDEHCENPGSRGVHKCHFQPLLALVQ